MRKNLFGASALLVILLGVVLCVESCRKNTTCVASVTVLNDLTSAPVSGALVKIGYSSSGKPDLQTGEGTTDGNGNVRISFKLEAVLDVTVTHSQYPKGGTTIIKLEAGKTTEKTVRL